MMFLLLSPLFLHNLTLLSFWCDVAVLFLFMNIFAFTLGKHIVLK